MNIEDFWYSLTGETVDREILSADRNVILTVINKEAMFGMRCANDQLRDDKEVVLAAVRKDGYSLYYASDRLKNDKNVVLTAVENDIDGHALCWASSTMTNDIEIILKAVEKHKHALQYASKIVQSSSYFFDTFYKMRFNGNEPHKLWWTSRV
jgi:hypothetical protein